MNANTGNKDFLATVQENPPAWGQEKLLRWDETPFERARHFITHHYWTSQGSINIFRVNGTDHPQYGNMTWMQLLERGKRMDINIPLLQKNPGYYTEPQIKREDMRFVSLDGINWYVSADGNHRTCLARFYFHHEGSGLTQLHEVSLSHYVIDRAFYSACQEISALIPALSAAGWRLSLDIRNTALTRDDSPGWKLDTFRVSATLTIDDLTREPVVVIIECHRAEEAQQALRDLYQRLDSRQKPPHLAKPAWWTRLVRQK